MSLNILEVIMFKNMVKKILQKRPSASLILLFGLVRSLFISCDTSMGFYETVDTAAPPIIITSSEITSSSAGEMCNLYEEHTIYENLAWKANFFLPDVHDTEFRALNHHMARY